MNRKQGQFYTVPTVLCVVLAIITAVVTTKATLDEPLESFEDDEFASHFMKATKSLSSPSENLIVSPYSVESSLAAAFCGARGNTLKQFNDVVKHLLLYVTSSVLQQSTRHLHSLLTCKKVFGKEKEMSLSESLVHFQSLLQTANYYSKKYSIN